MSSITYKKDLIRIIYIFIFVIFSIQSFAQNSEIETGNMSLDVLTEIASGKGEITLEEYEKFWNKLGITKPEDKMIAIKSIKNNLLPVNEFTYLMIGCAEQAWISQKVVSCNSAREKLKIIMQTPGLKEAENVKNLESQMNRLIEGSARRDVKSKEYLGYKTLSLEELRSLKERSKTMFARINSVLRPKF